MKKIVLLISALSYTVCALAQLSNAGFEEWDSATVVNGIKIYNPVNWYSKNAEMTGIGRTSPVYLSTDAHSGKYAVKIITKLDDNDKSAGILSSGNSEPISDPTKSAYEEKFKLTGKIKSYSAWYKYTPATELDSFMVMIHFYLKGQAYGHAFYTGGASDTYKQFTWSLSYPENIQMPDSAKFMIYSSIYEGNEGSELLLDDIEIQYKSTTGVEDKSARPSLSVYPNPAADVITLFGFPPKIRYVLIANSQGAILRKAEVNANEISISDLQQGMYWLVLEDEQGMRSTVKFTKE